MIAIIDYKAGNLTSVKLAFEALGVQPAITCDPAVLARAERLVFPGVGAAAAAMRHIRERGIVESIQDAVSRGVPFLGICLGMQILCDRSSEDGGTETLGLIPGNVVPLTPENPRDKVPHMGWNQICFCRRHPLFEGIADNSDFYFVHGYYPVPSNPEHCLAKTAYANVVFASVVGRDNLIATQFHPEKSGRVGLRMLQNFLNWRGNVPC